MVLPTLPSACVSVVPYIEKTVVQACALYVGVLTGKILKWLPSSSSVAQALFCEVVYGGCLEVSNLLEFTFYQFILLLVNAYWFFLSCTTTVIAFSAFS